MVKEIHSGSDLTTVSCAILALIVTTLIGYAFVYFMPRIGLS